MDSYHGYRDGKRGLPLVVADDAMESQTGEIGTPRLEMLRRSTAGRIEGEQLKASIDIARLSAVALPGLTTQIAAAAHRLQIVADAYAAASDKPSRDELGIRRLAEEEKKRPDVLVAARRLQEHRKREQQARQELLGATERHGSLLQRTAAVTGMADTRAEVARIRARRQYEHGWRRCATYWQQLVRTHPHGGVLNGLLRPKGPELPTWVTGSHQGTDADVDGGSS